MRLDELLPGLDRLGLLSGTGFEFAAPPARHGDLRVVALSGREAISELFTFDVLLSPPWDHGLPPPELEQELLGRPAHLSLRNRGTAPRVVHGIVASVALEGSAPENGRPSVRLKLVPRLWLATQKKRSRIFQDMTVRQVVDAVLDEWSVPRVWKVLEEAPPRTYCTQYHETDYEFIARLLAEEGIFFFFVPPAQGAEAKKEASGAPAGSGTKLPAEQLVLCDHENFYPSLASSGPSSRVPARPPLHFAAHEHGRAHDEASVLEFALQGAVRPDAALLSGYDERRPALKLRAGAQIGDADKKERAGRDRQSGTVAAGFLGVHQHHPRARYESTPGTSPVDTRRARKALEQLRRDACVGAGRSRNAHLAPGHAFRLVGHPMAEADREYVVTEVEHAGRAPDMVSEAVKEVYGNRFRCVPAGVRYRPPVPPRRMAQVAETATVVGPGEEEIHTDAEGRVRVRFHWDLAEAADGRDSCWMRVTQPWAGLAWGSQFIPRVGGEVVVTFVRGDPDDPLVTGCVYNGLNPTAFVLPEAKSRSGIRTASTPGGQGFNELSFEDRAGAEEVYLHAQRNLRQDVRHDHVVHVGGHRSVEVGGALTEVVKVARTETVLGNQVSAVLMNRLDTVGGEHRTVVQGPRVEIVQQAELREVGQQTTTVQGGRTLLVKGVLATKVGTADAPAEASTAVLGKHTTQATERILLSSEQEIVLVCGESRVVIGPEEVRIETKRLVMTAEEKALLEADGPALELTDQAQMTARAVKIHSQGASLELTSTADLNGAKVNLNCGGGSASIARAGPQAPELRPVTLKLHDDDMKPFAGKKYRLLAAGLKCEGTTDGEGGVNEQVPAQAKVGQLTLWLDDYPTGRTLDWTVELADEATAPANAVPGALLRLRHLGYYDGEVVDRLTPEAESALRLFQVDNCLEVTGALDAATAGKLLEVHGS